MLRIARGPGRQDKKEKPLRLALARVPGKTRWHSAMKSAPQRPTGGTSLGGADLRLLQRGSLTKKKAQLAASTSNTPAPEPEPSALLLRGRPQAATL